MKTLIALLVAASALAAVAPANATINSGNLPTFDGPAFGPKDLRTFDGPAFGPSDIRTFDGPAYGWQSGGNQR